MFVAPAASAAAAPANKKTTASTSPPPPASTTSSPNGSRKQEGVLSRWDSGGQGSGRLPPTTSRLDRALGTRSASPERPTRSTPPVDSIARARRLGLNRAPRTPPPPASESESDNTDEQETPVPLSNRARTRSRSSPSPTRVPPPARKPSSREEEDGGDRRRGAERTSSPPRREPSTSEGAEESAPPKPAPRPLPGLLSSLWNRASELVAGNAPAAAAPASDEAASSNKPGAQGEEGGADQADKGEGSAEADTPRRGKRPARPVVVPALVAPALAGVLPNAKIAPAPARSSAPTLPPPEPITYHRPPALHPRLNHEESPRFRSQPTPYDWLDARDESRLLPYMFLPTAAQAAAYEARMRAQANKAAAPHAAAAAAVSAPWPVAAPTSSAPPQAQAPPASSLYPSPMAMVAASMPVRGLQPERPTEARRAASDYGQQAPAQPPRERIRSNSASGAPLAAGGLALGALAGSGTATFPPLVQSAFASPPTSEPARSLGAELPAVTSSSAPVASVPAAPAPVPAPASAFGFPQAVPFLAAAPTAPYAGAAFAAPTVSAPPDEFLPRYTETEQAPRPASPATHPTISAAEESQAPIASAATTGAVGTAGQTVASSGQPAPEIPRAGLGGDSLPIHPSPAQYSAAAPSPAPVLPSYTSAPTGLAPAIVPWAAAPIQTAPSGSQSGNAPIPGVATSAPADTTAPSSQAPPPSLPPLVPPASFPAIQSAAAPCVPLPMVTSYPASFGNPAGPQDPQLPSLGPAALLRGAKTALKRAVLAVDPGADDFPSLSRRAQLGSGANAGEARPELTSKDDLPPMPKPRPIPVSPPPPSNPITSSRSSSDLSTTPLPNRTQRPPIHSAYVSPVARPLPGAAVSPATNQSPSSSQAPSESANTPRALPVLAAAEKADAHAIASVASSPSTASAGTSCSSPATTLPTVVTPPPPPPVPVKSPSLTSLTSLSPPPVPRRPASIPPLPEASLSATSPTSPSPQERACGHPETSPEELLDASPVMPAFAPVENPRIELQTLDLDLPDFGVGFSLATPSEADAGCTLSQIQSVTEERVTSYSIAAARPTTNGSSTLEPCTTASDPLDDAFEETTTFVAGFAQASLLRAGIDPNHTGRTEKWLEQMGVRPRLLSEMQHGQQSQQAETTVFPDSFFRPLTAPPASIAPEMTQRIQLSSPSLLYSLPPSEAAPSAPSKSPPPASLRLLSTHGLIAESNSTGSPLETSVGAIDSEGGHMKRGRAVSPDLEARARASRSAKVETLQTKTGSPASANVVTASVLNVTSAEHSENVALASVGIADFEPLVGDKGETASEVAAMFAHW